MKLNDIRMNMHTYLSKGIEPDFSLKSWILIYAALNAYIKIIESYNSNEYPEYLEMDVEDILKEYEKGTADEILRYTNRY